MRLPDAIHVQSAWAMASHRRRIGEVGAAELRVRLHDAATCIALAIGFLKEDVADEWTLGQARGHPVALLKDALTTLRGVDADLAHSVPAKRSALREELSQLAERLGLRLSLRILGSMDWLGPAHRELIRLAGREALMNTSRHAGVRESEINLDASQCPYRLEARDWGAGIGADASQGGGLVRLRRLAAWLGAELVVSSRSGLGTEIVLWGPTCPPPMTDVASGVGEETSS